MRQLCYVHNGNAYLASEEVLGERSSPWGCILTIPTRDLLDKYPCMVRNTLIKKKDWHDFRLKIIHSNVGFKARLQTHLWTRVSCTRLEHSLKSTGFWPSLFKQDILRSCKPPPQMAALPFMSCTLQGLQAEATKVYLMIGKRKSFSRLSGEHSIVKYFGVHVALVSSGIKGLYSAKCGQGPPSPVGNLIICLLRTMRLTFLSRPWHSGVLSRVHSVQADVEHDCEVTQVLTVVGTTVWLWPSTHTLESSFLG